MQHYSKRSSFAEKVLFPKKKEEEKKKRNLTTSTSHSLSHCKRCSLRFFSREKLPFGPLLASPRFSLQLQDFAAVFMETAALRVQKAKSCSRVTRALESASSMNLTLTTLSSSDGNAQPVKPTRMELRTITITTSPAACVVTIWPRSSLEKLAEPKYRSRQPIIAITTSCFPSF